MRRWSFRLVLGCLSWFNGRGWWSFPGATRCRVECSCWSAGCERERSWHGGASPSPTVAHVEHRVEARLSTRISTAVVWGAAAAEWLPATAGEGEAKSLNRRLRTSAKSSSPCSVPTSALPLLRRARRRVSRPRQAMSVAPREMASDLPGWVSGTHRVGVKRCCSAVACRSGLSCVLDALSGLSSNEQECLMVDSYLSFASPHLMDWSESLNTSGSCRHRRR